jgi:hypothetical protein
MLADQYSGGLTKRYCKRNKWVYDNDDFLMHRILIYCYFASPTSYETSVPIIGNMATSKQVAHVVLRLLQGMAPRSQSTRDIMRQEAKLQEMQEEVRRREMRGGVTSPQHYHVQPGGQNRPQVGRYVLCYTSILLERESNINRFDSVTVSTR